MVAPPNYDYARADLLLEVAFETKILISFCEQLVVNAPMRIVAGGAAFPDRFMLEHEGPALGDVTLHAGIRFSGKRRAASYDSIPAMRIMAICAADPRIHDRMTMGKVEPPLHVQMAGEADFGGFIRVYNGVARTAGLHMDARRAMAGFAAYIDGVRPISH